MSYQQNNTVASPSGWVMATVGDVTDSMKNGIYKPQEFYSDDGIASLRMYNIENGTLVWKDIKRLKLTPDEFRDYALEPMDILVNRVNSRELVGKAAVMPAGLEPCVYESKNIRLRLCRQWIESKYAGYWFQLTSQRYFSRNAQQTVGMASINQEQLGGMPIPLSPLAEQRRIVAKIEELFTRLDAGVESLKAAKKQLKRYRQSVLKAAVEGELTREWREQHKDELEPASELLARILRERREKWEADQLARMKAQGKPPKDDKWKAKYQGPATSNISTLPNLPEKWQWTTLEQLLLSLKNGSSAVPNADSGIRMLRISAVRPMRVNLSDCRFLPSATEGIDDYFLKEGDLLFTRYNGNPYLVGVCGVVRNLREPVLHPDKLIRGEIVSGLVLTSFLEVVLNTGYSRDFISRRAKTTAGQTGISGSDLKATPVPLTSIEEQDQIVAKVECRLSVADEIEAALDAELKRAERLRQSILKRAFEGKLVPQDPNDEPASVLLERIRAEKATHIAKPQRKGKRSRSVASSSDELFELN